MDMIKKALDISYVVEADIEDKVEMVDNVDIVDMLNKLDLIYQVAMMDPRRPGWPGICVPDDRNN